MRGRDVAQVSRAGAVHDARHAGLNAARVRAPFAAALVALASGTRLLTVAAQLQCARLETCTPGNLLFGVRWR